MTRFFSRKKKLWKSYNIRETLFIIFWKIRVSFSFFHFVKFFANKFRVTFIFTIIFTQLFKIFSWKKSWKSWNSPSFKISFQFDEFVFSNSQYFFKIRKILQIFIFTRIFSQKTKNSMGKKSRNRKNIPILFFLFFFFLNFFCLTCDFFGSKSTKKIAKLKLKLIFLQKTIHQWTRIEMST